MPNRHRIRGFTLLEVSAAVTIMGLLAGATYVVNRTVTENRAQSAAEELLASVVVAEKDLAGMYGTYSTFGSDVGMVTGLGLFGAAPATSPEAMSVAVSRDGWLGLATMPDVGACVAWRVAPLAEGGQQQTVTGLDACSGEAALRHAGRVPATQAAPVRPSP